MIYSPRFCAMSTSTVTLDCDVLVPTPHVGRIHSPELQGQKQVSLPSQVQGAWFPSHCLNWERLPLWVHSTWATVPHVREHASCFCLKRDCIIFRKPVHLSCWLYEEGGPGPSSRGSVSWKETSKLTSGFFVLRRISLASQAMHICVRMYIRETRLDQLHGNDPQLLPAPIGLRPRDYRT